MRIEYYESAGLWYWRVKAANGRVILDGAEGYAKKGNVLRAIDRFLGEFGMLADRPEIKEVKK